MTDKRITEITPTALKKGQININNYKRNVGVGR